jgi:hypothetical protein
MNALSMPMGLISLSPNSCYADHTLVGSRRDSDLRLWVQSSPKEGRVCVRNRLF